MIRRVFLLVLLTKIAFCRSANLNNDIEIKEDTQSSSVLPKLDYWKDMESAVRVVKDCAKDSLSVCFKLKLASGLGSVIQSSNDIEVIRGVTFVRDSEASYNTGPPVSEQEIEATLPRSLEGKESALTSLIFDNIISFFKTHTLQINLPSLTDAGEARKKDKKQGAFIMIPLLLGGTFIPIAYGALALLAGKALIVSKLALVLASIIGIKKLLSHGGHHESAHEVVVSGGHGGSSWGRDINLAYNGYAPKDRKSGAK